MVKTGDTLLVVKPLPDTPEWILKLEKPLVETITDDYLTFGVKDNIDVKGMPTTAACPEFSYTPEHHATVTSRLLSHGHHLLGKLNLDQFACGLNGTRSPYGIVPNAFNPEYICGGSSSGSAYAVATGQVDFTLGTDTAGSGRVPAGLNNIVGIKPSKGLLPTRGVVPAAASADCVSIFSRAVDVGWRVLMQAKGYDSEDPFSRNIKLNMTLIGGGGNFKFGIPDKLEFFGDADSEICFEESLSGLQDLGGEKRTIDFSKLSAVASMLYEDAFVAERYHGIREFFDRNENSIVEPVRSIIAKGKGYSAADLYDAQLRLREYNQSIEPMWQDIDILVVPTAPTHYKISEMLRDPVALNRNLGTYTNFVNLLDYAAVSVPSCFRKDGLPFGITLIGRSGSDFQLAELAQRFHHSRNLPSGALNIALGEPRHPLRDLAVHESTLLAVVGAHLQGMPLHHQLTSKNAKFVERSRTAAKYKLYAIANSVPPKPALVYVGDGEGTSIEIEIYEISFEAVGRFLNEIPPPLGLGTIHVVNGTSVKGFIAEPRAIIGAEDISAFGGWRAFISKKAEVESTV